MGLDYPNLSKDIFFCVLKTNVPPTNYRQYPIPHLMGHQVYGHFLISVLPATASKALNTIFSTRYKTEPIALFLMIELTLQ